jgi:hypothetical protein
MMSLHLATSGNAPTNWALVALLGSLLAAPGLAAGLTSGATAEQPAPGVSASAIAAQRAWWTAFIVAATANLQAHSAPELAVTISGGQTYDRAATMVEAATHLRGKNLLIEWLEESVQFPEPSIAIVTTRVRETAGPVGVYRYLTVLRRSGQDWMVVAAQSTRELSLTPRVPEGVAGTLADFAGKYQIPKGAVMPVSVRGAGLLLVEPEGLQIPLEPVGPGVFEFDRLSLGNGLVRILFTRDSNGRVTGMTRLLVGAVTTFPKLP